MNAYEAVDAWGKVEMGCRFKWW